MDKNLIFSAEGVSWIWSDEGAHARPEHGSGSAYEVRRFRKEFDLPDAEADCVGVAISADSRYELYLDGRLLGRGPAHGDVRHQFYDWHELSGLCGGRHVVAVKVFDYSPVQCDPPRFGAPAAVMTRTGGLAAEVWMTGGGAPPRRLAMTDETWKVCIDRSLAFHNGKTDWFGGFVGLFEEFLPSRDEARGWTDADFDDSGWDQAFAMYSAERFERKTDAMSPYGLTARMVPMTKPLPPTIPIAVFYEGGAPVSGEWDACARGERSVTVAPDSVACVLIELDKEWTGFPALEFGGGEGSEIRLGYAEALRFPKGVEDAVVFGDGVDIGDVAIGYENGQEGWTFDRRGKFEGFEDILRPDGREWSWSPHHWRCAKFLRLWVRTGAEPLRVGRFHYAPCHYPLEEMEPFQCSDERIERVHEIGLHTLRLGMHETFLDCPYYEQLQYIGDSSLNAQVAMMAGGAYDIVRQLILHFDWSRVPEGWTQSRYPSRIEGIIPSQSLDWISAIHSYALHSGDLDTVREVWPGALAVLGAYQRHCGPGGLPEKLPYWNWIDWCPGWKRGVPPGAESGPVLSHAAKYAIALRQAAGVAHWIGDSDAEKQLDARQRGLRAAAYEAFWNGRYFSENTIDRSYGSRLGNALAVLAGFVDETEDPLFGEILEGRTLPDCSFFGMYFVRQALWRLGRCDIERELEPWFDMLECGLTTWPEDTTFWRSLCHGWSANPSIDFYTRVLGVQPTEPGFRRVRIEPAVACFQSFSGAVSTPRGAIRIAWDRLEDEFMVDLPSGVDATLQLPDMAGQTIGDGGSHTFHMAKSKTLCAR